MTTSATPQATMATSSTADGGYDDTLIGREPTLYALRNSLDPLHPEQLQRRMAAEQTLNEMMLARWEGSRPAGAPPLAPTLLAFGELNRAADQACAQACGVVAGLPCDARGYRRRFADNLATNARLVDTIGRVGITRYDPMSFCNAVLTHAVSRPPVGCAGALQVQGCRVTPGFDVLLQTARAYAKRVKARHVLFVNVAGTQIPPYFAASLWAKQARALPQPAGMTTEHRRAWLAAPGDVEASAYGIEGTYIEYGAWPDGLLVSPDTLHRLAHEIADLVVQRPATLMVFGCNAGKDRSGLTNALVRLALAWRAHGVPDDVAPDILRVVAQIQQARPEALRTAERFKLLFFAAEALAARYRDGSQVQAQVPQAATPVRVASRLAVR